MAKNKGNYYKIKTKKWFIGKGYVCEYTEKSMRIVSKGKVIFVKKDCFFSDGIAVNKDELIFWNSVFGRANIASHIKQYASFEVPNCEHIKKWVIIWEKRKSEPEIEEVK